MIRLILLSDFTESFSYNLLKELWLMVSILEMVPCVPEAAFCVE